MDGMRRSWVEVDLEALSENITALREVLAENTEIMFVVKADAYGHGAVALAERAVATGVRWFTVAYVQEALELREALPSPHILVMGAVEPADVPGLLEHRITPIVVSEEHARLLGEAACRQGDVLDVHLKIDTGMGRLGVPWEDAAAVYRRLLDCPGLRLTGACSHFAAVEPGHPEGAKDQLGRFRIFERERRAFDDRPIMRHISSSRAMLYYGAWDLDGVRPGIALYGYGARDEAMRASTRPILQWKASVMQVRSVPANFPVGYYGTYRTGRPTTLATLCVGYADGFLRTLSNRGIVLIGGRRHPVVGRVSMNWVTVDVGPDADVKAGDEAVLIGRQGKEQVWADELARLCRTIPYEILTNIDARIQRTYAG
jgi:alanine racemase